MFFFLGSKIGRYQNSARGGNKFLYWLVFFTDFHAENVIVIFDFNPTGKTAATITEVEVYFLRYEYQQLQLSSEIEDETQRG